jgi:hypothetical protein
MKQQDSVFDERVVEEQIGQPDRMTTMFDERH